MDTHIEIVAERTHDENGYALFKTVCGEYVYYPWVIGKPVTCEKCLSAAPPVRRALDHAAPRSARKTVDSGGELEFTESSGKKRPPS